MMKKASSWNDMSSIGVMTRPRLTPPAPLSPPCFSCSIEPAPEFDARRGTSDYFALLGAAGHDAKLPVFEARLLTGVEHAPDFAVPAILVRAQDDDDFRLRRHPLLLGGAVERFLFAAQVDLELLRRIQDERGERA